MVLGEKGGLWGSFPYVKGRTPYCENQIKDGHKSAWQTVKLPEFGMSLLMFLLGDCHSVSNKQHFSGFHAHLQDLQSLSLSGSLRDIPQGPHQYQYHTLEASRARVEGPRTYS